MLLLHVLLVLLKMTGILLAVLIGLLILVLAAPVRYSFWLDKKEKMSPAGKLKVTWLWFVIYCRASYIDKMFDYQIRIFGYQILGSQEEFLEKKRKREHKKEEKKQKKENKKREKKRKKEKQERECQAQEEPETLRGTSFSEEDLVSDDSSADESFRAEGQEEKSAEDVKDQEDGRLQEEETKEQKLSFEKETTNKTQKTAGTNKGKKSAFEKKKHRKSEKKEGKMICLRKTVYNIKEAYREYHGEQLLDFGKQSIIKILRHVLPRKLQGYIRFGFDDPAATGMAAGAAALFYPKYQRHFSVEPDFQNQCFEAVCKGRGRIHLGFFVYFIITAILNPDVRNIIKLMK